MRCKIFKNSFLDNFKSKAKSAKVNTKLKTMLNKKTPKTKMPYMGNQSKIRIKQGKPK